MVEGVPLLECSPPARRRRAAGEADGTDESLLSEGTSTEAAWPWSQTADGGRLSTETGADQSVAGRSRTHTRELRSAR